MLDLHYLKIDYGVSYGSVALKSLQNENVPELDLLVREAIQNSSDASLNMDGDSYSVNFRKGFFSPSSFNKFLTGIEDVLDDRYSDVERAEYLEIRDTDTTGLTGCIRKEDIPNNKDDHGNFFKLIFDTGKKQTNEAAGGNWGFGKSVYYRVGIGIVVFYSRIKTEDSFEDRLIITLIEDEGKKDSEGEDATILGPLKERYAGKAWWGIWEGPKENGNLLPLTDMELIQPILDVFEIKRFKDEETGTSIIIPYIDSKKLLEATVPVEGDQREDIKNTFKSVFTSDLSSYLKLSIQKWYAPKIQNLNLKNLTLEPEARKWLRVYVNNEPLRKDGMFGFFKLVQELYTTALAKANGDTYESSDFPEIKTEDIDIRLYLENGMRAGCVSVIRTTTEKISDYIQELSPFDYLGKFEAEGNEPVLMYAREPGMVIDYETAGPWVHNLIRPEKSDECIFAFFVPETRKRIRGDASYGEFAGKQLGAYLRKCEASDHMNWSDQKRMKIVEHIQRQTIRKINDQSRTLLPGDSNASPSRLSDKLGKSLLPQIMYGNNSSRAGGLGSGSGSGSGSHGSSNTRLFVVEGSNLHGNNVYVDFKLKSLYKGRVISVALMISSEGGSIDAESWNNEIGSNFPIHIEKCVINSILRNGESKPDICEITCDLDSTISASEDMSVSMCSSPNENIYTILKFESKGEISEVKGTIILCTDDKKFKASFSVD